MGVKYFDKVYARPAGERFMTCTNASLAGYNLIPIGCKVTANVSLKSEPDITTPMGDGTDNIGAIANNVELEFIDFETHYNTIVTNFVNRGVDVVLVDSNLPNQGWAAFGVQLFPTLDMGTNKENTLKLSGKGRQSSIMANRLVFINITGV